MLVGWLDRPHQSVQVTGDALTEDDAHRAPIGTPPDLSIANLRGRWAPALATDQRQRDHHWWTAPADPHVGYQSLLQWERCWLVDR